MYTVQSRFYPSSLSYCSLYGNVYWPISTSFYTVPVKLLVLLFSNCLVFLYLHILVANNNLLPRNLFWYGLAQFIWWPDNSPSCFSPRVVGGDTGMEGGDHGCYSICRHVLSPSIWDWYVLLKFSRPQTFSPTFFPGIFSPKSCFLHVWLNY